MTTIKELVQTLKKADQVYYGRGKSKLSDQDYDQLKEELRERKPNHKYLLTVGSDAIPEKG